MRVFRYELGAWAAKRLWPGGLDSTPRHDHHGQQKHHGLLLRMLKIRTVVNHKSSNDRNIIHLTGAVNHNCVRRDFASPVAAVDVVGIDLSVISWTKLESVLGVTTNLPIHSTGPPTTHSEWGKAIRSNLSAINLHFANID